MLDVLLLLVLGKLQDVLGENSKPWQWALAYAAVTLVLSMGGDAVGALVSTVVLGLYSWGYFALLRRFTDNLAMWLLTLLGGAVFPFVLVMVLGNMAMKAAGAN